jgi:putative transposase
MPLKYLPENSPTRAGTDLNGKAIVQAYSRSTMRSKPVTSVLVDLDATKSHRRPYTLDDDPYLRSQFESTKYRTNFPDRFGSIEDARSHRNTYLTGYNGG